MHVNKLLGLSNLFTVLCNNDSLQYFVNINNSSNTIQNEISNSMSTAVFWIDLKMISTTLDLRDFDKKLVDKILDILVNNTYSQRFFNMMKNNNVTIYLVFDTAHPSLLTYMNTQLKKLQGDNIIFEYMLSYYIAPNTVPIALMYIFGLNDDWLGLEIDMQTYLKLKNQCSH